MGGSGGVGIPILERSHRVGQESLIDSRIVRAGHIKSNVGVRACTEHCHRKSISGYGDRHLPGRLINDKAKGATALDALQKDQAIGSIYLAKSRRAIQSACLCC